MKAKVLVTGATGLLGSNIVSQLNQKGYWVKVLVRNESSLDALVGCEYEKVIGDITDKHDLENALKECDYVIHAAAKTALGGNDFSAFEKVNVQATKNLVELAIKHGIKRFIYVSTANCFTNGTLDNPGTEESGFMSWLEGSAYAYSKFLAQQFVLEQAKNNNLPALVVAPTFLIGPRDVKPSSGRLLLYVLKNKIVFYPKGGKSFVDVENAAEAIVNSLERGRIGQSYLIAGENMTYKQFFKLIAQVTNSKKLFIPIPSMVLSLIAIFVTYLEKIFGIQTSFTYANQRLLTLDNYFSNKKAKQELGLKPTSIINAINKAVSWFENSKDFK